MPAGLQDRVIQAYQGLVYMDFSKSLMDARGYGEYERMDAKLLPNVFVAYRNSTCSSGLSYSTFLICYRN